MSEGDGGRMDDETLAELRADRDSWHKAAKDYAAIIEEIHRRLDSHGIPARPVRPVTARIDELARELGDTRARLAEAQAKVAVFVGAVDGMHPVYGSTSACHGGIGGSTVTEHCAHVCQSWKHDKARERYEAARTDLYEWQRAALGATDQAGDGG